MVVREQPHTSPEPRASTGPPTKGTKGPAAIPGKGGQGVKDVKEKLPRSHGATSQSTLALDQATPPLNYMVIVALMAQVLSSSLLIVFSLHIAWGRALPFRTTIEANFPAADRSPRIDAALTATTSANLYGVVLLVLSVVILLIPGGLFIKLFHGRGRRWHSLLSLSTILASIVIVLIAVVVIIDASDWRDEGKRREAVFKAEYDLFGEVTRELYTGNSENATKKFEILVELHKRLKCCGITAVDDYYQANRTLFKQLVQNAPADLYFSLDWQGSASVYAAPPFCCQKVSNCSGGSCSQIANGTAVYPHSLYPQPCLQAIANMELRLAAGVVSAAAFHAFTALAAATALAFNAGERSKKRSEEASARAPEGVERVGETSPLLVSGKEPGT